MAHVLKYVQVEAALSELSVERFDEAMLLWLSRLYEDKGYSVLGCPGGESDTAKFRSIVRTKEFRISTELCDTVERFANLSTRHRVRRVKKKTLPRRIVNHCEYPKLASGRFCIT
jgi:hypothetical protein